MKGVLFKVKQSISYILKYRLNLFMENYFFLCPLNQLFTEIRKYSVDIQNQLGKTVLD